MVANVTVSRVFNAPIEDVWKVWTDPEYVMQWWGPDHFTCPSAIIDFREGGKSIVCMRAPKEFNGGGDSYSIWEYTKIDHHKSIEFTQNLSNKEGIKQDPAALGMPPDFPTDIKTVVTFKKLEDNKTEMTVVEYADFGQMSHFAKLGLEQSLDKARRVFADKK